MALLMLAAFATLALTGVAAVTIVNALTFPRLDQAPLTTTYPRVSVLIPARNEVLTLPQTLSQLLNQRYPDFEILVLDDDSSDGTAEAARAAGGGDPRLRVMTGQPLPEGWLGKNWACHQLSRVATGEILLFTDADVFWSHDALKRIVGEMEARQSDLQTVWPTQITHSWSERLVVPLIAFAIIGYLPLLAVHHLPWPVFAAAMGQCLAFRRVAYAAIGGHAAVRDSVIEDVALAKRIKKLSQHPVHGRLKLRAADGGNVLSCRMYRTWAEVRDGFAKNLLAGHGDSILWLLLSWAFHWLLWFLPWIWLATGAFLPTRWWPTWPLLLVTLGVAVRAMTAAVTQQRISDALLMPVSVLLMAVIAAKAIWWRLRYGGPEWRGRRAVTASSMKAPKEKV